MNIRCICLGLLIITLAGCNRAAHDLRADYTPISAHQDHNVLFPKLHFQLDQEIRARLNAMIAQNLSKDTDITTSDKSINTALKIDQGNFRKFDMAGQMHLHCSGLCENAQLRGVTMISIDLDNRHFALDQIALRDDEHGVTLTGSINQFLYGIDYNYSLADANMVLRTPDDHIEIVDKATLLMEETPSNSREAARGQIEISDPNRNIFLWGNYLSANP